MSDQRPSAGGKGGIAWTDETWNPLRGCSRVSEGCRNCYAETMAWRFSGPGQPYEGLTRPTGDGARWTGARWTGTIKLVPEKLGEPLRWQRPRMVFVNSMSDLFHEAVPFEFVAACFGVMAAAGQHTFQVLTKRPERAAEFFAWAVEQDRPRGQIQSERGPRARGEEGTPGRLECCWQALAHEARAVGDDGPLHRKHAADPHGPWPLPNVWLGVSVEDQRTADERIPVLLQCPAAIRWVSYEPALGPVEFVGLREHLDEFGNWRAGAGLDWIVVGGESGPGARPFDLAWARSTIAACAAANVRCFVKQLGACPRDSVIRWVDSRGEALGAMYDRKGGDPAEWPADLRVRQWPEAPATGSGHGDGDGDGDGKRVELSAGGPRPGDY